MFGGSFDPPHVGHVLAVAYLLATAPIDRVVVVPCHSHAFGKDLLAFEARRELAEVAFGWIPRVEVSAIERELGAPSRTLRTLEALSAALPRARLRLVVGADVLGERERWYRWDEVVRLAEPLLLGRAGHPHAEAPAAVLPEVSSTEIRARLRCAPLPRTEDPELARLVPREVLRRLDALGLYR